MTPSWHDVRCASVPEEALSVLADLRRDPGIRVTIVGGRAWVRWDDGPASEATRRILVDRLLPLAGVEIFLLRDGRWHRPGRRLPSFHVPIGEGSGSVRLDRAILPELLEIVPPNGESTRPVQLRLVRDDREAVRPATAMRCRLGNLADWAESVPTAWIQSLFGAWCSPADGEPDEALVLLLGSAIRLPSPEDSLRLWGNDVLMPLGYRPEPELTDRALHDAVGAGPDDLVVLDDQGPELIPRGAFRPLSRAAIRSARASGGGPP